MRQTQTDGGPWIAGSANTSTHFHAMRDCHTLKGSGSEIRTPTQSEIEFHNLTACPDCKQTLALSEIDVPPADPDGGLAKFDTRYPAAHVQFVDDIVAAGLFPSKAEVYRTALSEFVDRFELPSTASDVESGTDPVTVDSGVGGETQPVATDGSGVVDGRGGVGVSTEKVNDVLERIDSAIEQNEAVVEETGEMAAAKTDAELRAARSELGELVDGEGRGESE